MSYDAATQRSHSPPLLPHALSAFLLELIPRAERGGGLSLGHGCSVVQLLVHMLPYNRSAIHILNASTVAALYDIFSLGKMREKFPNLNTCQA